MGASVGDTFGERLRRLRIDAGLSQVELAGDGLSASYISLLEGNKRTASSEVAHKLARRLGCSASLLMEGQPSERDELNDLELKFARLAIEHGEAREARNRLIRLLEDDGLPERVRADASYLLASACSRTGEEGDFERGIRLLLPLFKLACNGDSHLLVSHVGLTLCGMYLDSGDLKQAAVVGETALEAAQAQGLGDTDDYYRLAATVMYAYIERGDFLHARIFAEDLLKHARADDQRSGQAALYWNLALLAERQGRVREALTLAEQALARLSELDETRDYARLRLFIAITMLADDPPQHVQAATVLERCADGVNDLGSADDKAQWHWAMSQALLHAGDVQGAEFRARQARDLSRSAPGVCADALHALSDALAAQGRDDEAAEARRQAGEAMRDVPESRSAALDLRELGERLLRDDPEGAVSAFRRALQCAGIPDRSAATRQQVAALRRARATVSTQA